MITTGTEAGKKSPETQMQMTSSTDWEVKEMDQQVERDELVVKDTISLRLFCDRRQYSEENS